MGRAPEEPVQRAGGLAGSKGAGGAPPAPARARRGNPYVAGNAVGGSDAFVGREDVIRAVVRALAEPRNQGIVLYGQRRIGKTSILQHLSATLPERTGHRPVYFDLQDKAAESLDAVLAELALEIAEALGLPKPAPGPNVEAWFQDAWLPKVLRSLPDGVSLVLLFDEFDVLADVQTRQAASALFPYLRRLLEKNAPRLRVVFVIGRNIEDLENVAHALFKGIPSWQVSLLPQKDAEALIRLSEANGTLAWSEEAVAAAWALTHGHPLLLQALCGQVWVHAREDRRPQDATRPAVAAEVEAAVEPTLGSSRNAFEWLWKGLPPGTRVVAAALAQAGPEAVEEEALHQVLRENGVRVIIRELQAAPKVLVDWDLVEAPAPGRYQFRVELLRRLIARYKPPARVQEDLDLVEPVAENMYRAGEGLYRIGKLADATTQLYGALGLNPNHVKASGLLADTLISAQDWAGARTVLERLYENNPAVARARLVQVLLVHAEAETAEDAKLDLYVRVQSIDKRNTAAATWIQAIWKVRGDRARRAGNLAGAVEAYRAGGLSELEAEVAREQRKMAIAAGLAEMQALEKAENYEGALELVRQLAKEHGDLRNWQADAARIEEALETERTYRFGVQAMRAPDKEHAKRLFAEVVSRSPSYKDAVGRLHTLVTGVDPMLLLAKETKARADAHARAAKELAAEKTARAEADARAAKELAAEKTARAEAEKRARASARQCDDLKRAVAAERAARESEATGELNSVHLKYVALRDEVDSIRAQRDDLAQALHTADAVRVESEKREAALARQRDDLQMALDAERAARVAAEEAARAAPAREPTEPSAKRRDDSLDRKTVSYVFVCMTATVLLAGLAVGMRWVSVGQAGLGIAFAACSTMLFLMFKAK